MITIARKSAQKDAAAVQQHAAGQRARTKSTPRARQTAAQPRDKAAQIVTKKRSARKRG